LKYTIHTIYFFVYFTTRKNHLNGTARLKSGVLGGEKFKLNAVNTTKQEEIRECEVGV